MKSKETYEVPKDVQVFEEKRTNAKTFAIPITFPDGTNGLLMVSRISKFGWKPYEHIEQITIEYKHVN